MPTDDKPSPKKRRRVLHSVKRSALVDRLEAAVDSGLIDLVEDRDDSPAKNLVLTSSEVKLLFAWLFPGLPPPA